jgi:hypothetical protein
MRRILYALILASALSAQTPSTATIGAQGPGRLPPKNWTIILRDRTVLADHFCDMQEMEPGDVATCTVALNQVPRVASPVIVQIMTPEGFSAPIVVTISAPSKSATYKLTRLDPQAVAAVWPMLASVWVANSARVTRYALFGTKAP